MMRLGTRASPLALAQANLVAEAVRQAHPGIEVELHPIRTHGDEGGGDAGLAGKALFTQRIEEALVEGRIDAAVHSLKDLPSASMPGIVLAAVPRREDPRDALVSFRHGSFASLPPGATVATSSIRRAAQLRRLRPDLRIQPLSGNVGTRIEKLRVHGWDGVVLAAAGLNRLGLGHLAVPLPSSFLPAPGQGALAVQALEDGDASRILHAIEDRTARAAVEAERHFARLLGGDCNVPLAALATVASGALALDACVLAPDGTRGVQEATEGPASDPHGIAASLAQRFLHQGARRFLEEATP